MRLRRKGGKDREGSPLFEEMPSDGEGAAGEDERGELVDSDEFALANVGACTTMLVSPKLLSLSAVRSVAKLGVWR